VNAFSKGIDGLASSLPQKSIPSSDSTRVFQDEGYVSIHGLRVDKTSDEIYPLSLLNSITAEEEEQGQKLDKPWRKMQYFVGRIMCKRCVADIWKENGIDLGLEAVAIVNDDSGAPQCKIDPSGEASAVSVSLTHKRETLLAAASTHGLVGIDFEDLSDTHPGLRRWSSVDSDRQRDNEVRSGVERTCGLSNEHEITTAIWCAREAAYKALSRSRVLSPLAIVLTPVEDHIVATIGPDYPLQANIVLCSKGPFVCALAI
jgi:phosphopantetheinyl transferase (holo-ACP synthase)